MEIASSAYPQGLTYWMSYYNYWTYGDSTVEMIEADFFLYSRQRGFVCPNGGLWKYFEWPAKQILGFRLNFTDDRYTGNQMVASTIPLLKVSR
jgi:hypothetical protein